jgi:hypothetical protein
MRNLHMRCFARDNAVLQEEFVGGDAAGRMIELALKNDPNKNSIGWGVVPDNLRTSPYR